MTFGKCVWNGCTRHAEKAETGACRAHHVIIRDSRCQICHGPITSKVELDRGRCRRCTAVRAA